MNKQKLKKQTSEFRPTKECKGANIGNLGYFQSLNVNLTSTICLFSVPPLFYVRAKSSPFRWKFILPTIQRAKWGEIGST